MKSKKTDSLVLLATVVLTTGIFVLDLLTPLGVAIWVFYMLPLLIVSRATERLTPFILAAVCTVLIALGFIYSPPGVKLYLAFINRLMGVGVLWTMAVLLVHRSKMEETQKEHENLLRKIIESEPECVKLVSPDGTILEMNPAGLAMIEADSPEQVLGKSIYGIVTPEYRSVFKELTEGVFRGESQMLEFEMVGLKGTHYWLETHAAPLRNQKGEITTLLGITRDITERKRAEKALQVSEERLQLAITGAGMGTWHWDIANDELMWSDRCKAIFGIPLDTPMSYERFLDALHPEDRERANQAVMDALNNRTEYDIEYRTVWRDGSIHWVTAKGRGYYDGSGNAVRMEGIALDITNRKLIEQERESLLHRNTSLVKALGEIVYDWIVPTDELFWGGEFTNVLGYSEEEMGKDTKSWTDRVHPEDLGRVLNEVENAVKQQRLYDLEYRFRNRDGSYRWMHDRGVPHCDAEGKLQRIIGVFRDITERKQAEKALREKENLLSESQRIAHIGGWSWDLTGPIIWTDETYRIYGVSPETFTPTVESLVNLVHPEDRPAMQQWIEACAAGEKPRELQFRAIPPDGSVRFLSGHGELMYDAENKPACMSGTVQDITDRKRAEEAMRESEARYIRAVNGANDGIWEWTPATGEDYLSPRWKQWLGYQDHELPNVQESFFNQIHQDDQSRVSEAVRAHLEERKPYEIELRMRCKSGEYRWFYARGQATWDEQGQPLRMAGSITDITERKQAEQRLEQNRALLLAFVEQAPAAVAMLDTNLRYVAASRRWVEDYNLGGRKLIGQRHYDIFPEIWHRKDWQDVHQRCLAGAVERREEDPFVREDGTTNWLRWEVRPWHDEDERIGGIMIFSEDITERKRTEAALRESEEKFRILAETSVAAIFVFHGEQLRYANPAATTISGYANDELLNLRFWDIIHPEFRELVRQRGLARQRDEMIPTRYEVKILTKEGDERWVDFGGGLMMFEGKPAAIGVAFDITDRKLAEEALHKAYDELEIKVAERTNELMEANIKLKEVDRLKSEFLATMSHELRTPLNSIIGFTGILLQGLSGEINEEQRKQLSMVYGSAKHLLNLINDILDLSRIESGKVEVSMQRFMIKDVVSEVAHSLAPMISQKGLRLITEILDEPLEIFSDRKKVFQILLNLVNNAVKFTERGEIRTACKADHNNLEVTVSDTGVGIKKENMKLLFEAFRQIDGTSQRRYEGAGLGLHLCQRMVTLLGGRIWVESEYGKGSRFTFTLPLRPMEEK